MALPRKAQMEIEELKKAGVELKEILKGLRKKEDAPERLVKDLDRLLDGYDKEILKAVYGIDVR